MHYKIKWKNKLMGQYSKIKEKKVKQEFKNKLKEFAAELSNYAQTDDGHWTIKGFIDVYKNIYTISADTKIVSKILEIHLFPKILEFAESNGYIIQLTEHQNHYPDLTFIKKNNENFKFALDLKTTYRDPKYPDYVNGFTLGSHGAYFTKRDQKKNIQYPYSEYSGHFCLGIIYTRMDGEKIDETEIFSVKELEDYKADKPPKIGEREVTTVDNLKSISSVIKDFQFFAVEKWEIASDRQGSGNTANIGSIIYIPDIINGNGVFSKLGEDWFDEYWMNYKMKIKKGGKVIELKRLEDYVEFRSGDVSLVNHRITRNKQEK